MRLCLIYNFAQHYRSSIFKLIDQEYNCDFVFGDKYLDVKKMDYSILRGKVTEVRNKHLPGGWFYQSGVQKLLSENYDKYILLGESRNLSTWLFCIRAKLFYPKKKIYFWSHGWYGKESWIEKKLKKILFSLPNGGTFLYGNYARNLMIKEGFNPDKLYVIHNSLAYDQQLCIRRRLTCKPIYKEHFCNNDPNLIFVGRLSKVKKLDMILHTIVQMNEAGLHCNLTLIGDGETKQELQDLSRELGLQRQIWFYGACYDENLLGEMIYNADLCVSPGNIGLTAMHCMVFGTPAITHDNFPYQMPEFEAIHDGETGSFFHFGDVSSLANSIKQWFMLHEGNRELVRKACMEEIDNYWTPVYQINVLKKFI